ncbi:hypothetical protein ACIHEI_05200 [Kitasatospora sp. NPDC051984]|uniref:hypothetical protein n=1 Tax=unclassified Kitasatospora TaxID=2633591 RepID=UPI0037210DF7
MTGPEQVAEARRTRFGTLPQRIPFADMVEERPEMSTDPAAFDPDSQAIRFSCLAADLGL